MKKNSKAEILFPIPSWPGSPPWCGRRWLNFLNTHPEVADALRPAWERLQERWQEAVRRDALSRSGPQRVRRDTAYEE